MEKFEFLQPHWSDYKSNEMREISALRKIIFHLIREIHVLRETNIQNAIDHNHSPKETLYGKLYYETCILSYNSSGPLSGEEKILNDWFNKSGGPYDEILMLKKLGYTQQEIDDYMKLSQQVGQYT